MADGLDVSVGLAVRVCCRMEGAGRRLVAPLHVRSTGVALALAAGRGTPASGGGGRWSPTLRPPSPPAVPVEPSPWTRGVPALHPAGRWARCGWGSTRLRGGVEGALGVPVDTTDAVAAGAVAVAAAGAAWPPGRDERVAPPDCRRKPCLPTKPTPPACPPRPSISPALLPNVPRPPVRNPTPPARLPGTPGRAAGGL